MKRRRLFVGRSHALLLLQLASRWWAAGSALRVVVRRLAREVGKLIVRAVEEGGAGAGAPGTGLTWEGPRMVAVEGH